MVSLPSPIGFTILAKAHISWCQRPVQKRDVGVGKDTGTEVTRRQSDTILADDTFSA